MRTVRLELPWLDFCEVLQYLNSLPPTAPQELLKLRELYMAKLNKLVEHELYTKYKSAPTEAQREEARQKYLEQRQIPESFRW